MCRTRGGNIVSDILINMLDVRGVLKSVACPKYCMFSLSSFACFSLSALHYKFNVHHVFCLRASAEVAHKPKTPTILRFRKSSFSQFSEC